jgi:hypothetical protein
MSSEPRPGSGHLGTFRRCMTTTVSDARTPNGGRVGVIAFNMWMTTVAQLAASTASPGRWHRGRPRGNPGDRGDDPRIAGHSADAGVARSSSCEAWSSNSGQSALHRRWPTSRAIHERGRDPGR